MLVLTGASFGISWNLFFVGFIAKFWNYIVMRSASRAFCLMIVFSGLFVAISPIFSIIPPSQGKQCDLFLLKMKSIISNVLSWCYRKFCVLCSCVAHGVRNSRCDFKFACKDIQNFPVNFYLKHFCALCIRTLSLALHSLILF